MSCLTADPKDRIAVAFAPSPNAPSTADMGPNTHVFELPDDVTISPVVIEVSCEDRSEIDTRILEQLRTPALRDVTDVRLILTRGVRVFHPWLILVASVPSQESAD